MAVAICDHYNYVRKCLCNKNAYDEEYNKQNALLIVPTGLVKTYLIKNVAKLIDVPFAKVDATKFFETWFAGSNVEDMAHVGIETLMMAGAIAMGLLVMGAIIKVFWALVHKTVDIKDFLKKEL